jgi:hypothetical protein
MVPVPFVARQCRGIGPSAFGSRDDWRAPPSGHTSSSRVWSPRLLPDGIRQLHDPRAISRAWPLPEAFGPKTLALEPGAT